jgi:hypothetical protein
MALVGIFLGLGAIYAMANGAFNFGLSRHARVGPDEIHRPRVPAKAHDRVRERLSRVV